ncbi:peptide chain release factor N(5)-glutamine methyltransferase [Borrelia miyamotoi]|uniref:peptide chain release factor N(5)-glutamine methyltransferase n=1 Tax=Borrelia miyamotoi TaxID=47466 RepID=A0AAX3JMF0_9SPIR|nr:peptide chain release factor N(5)-glutamine methyltransferase [Borrelia miyamotoi]QFP42116.1 peptide chain release factor N(5)-glutamine methyltransferase [Borrelia miyamotoi]QFP48231.1 peptide chain release factor N(5)-glutamine methyltransferase [Borrelia miyamotoi]QGT55990.1 peptide chain release factor N(5)-glutamine methyltransferase [Borrelia miyamotoi]QGT56771.1 peptide chain release factor N(5)-glutamine methyltransferase [Borrelia miyamotoi]WAZ72031.1 peptide chain release factor N
MTINEAIKNAKKYNLNTLEILLLLEKILKNRKEIILANINKKLTKQEENKLLHQINKIKSGTLIHHILGTREFMGIKFYINKHVLIPRADTECIVEEALIQIQKNNLSKILDLCCGSGCIGLTIAHYSKLKVTLSDISIKALKVASKNKQKLKLENYIEIQHSDLLKCIDKEFELIITNPPYLNKDELKIKEKLTKEPRIALLGFGKDGLEISKKIIRQAKCKLAQNGLLIMEMAPWQTKSLKKFAIQEGFKYLKTIYDIERRERGLILRINHDTSL